MRHLAIALTIAMPLIARAQNVRDGALTLTPAVIMLRGTFGQTTTQRLTLTNGTSLDLTFDLLARDVVVRDGRRAFVEPGEADGSIAASAVFSRKQIALRSGESSSVDVTFTMPRRTSIRAVTALFRTTKPIGKGAKSMIPAVGTLMTFRVTDGVDVQGSDLAIRPQSATANAAFSATYTNAGTEPVVAKGVVAILDARGALVGRSAMPAHRLLPSERVEMKSQYPGELAPGRYRIVVTTDLEGTTFTKDAEMVVK
jgi:hypothetical protein